MSRDRVFIIAFPHVTIEVPYIGQVPEIGHGGVLLLNGSTGYTRYFEYGRYDSALGEVYTRPVPNLTMIDGEPDTDSLRACLRAISAVAGKRTPVDAVSFLTEDEYQTGLDYCIERQQLNNDPTREPYSVLTNNCILFADRTARLMMSWLAEAALPNGNPIPHVYIRIAQVSSIPVPDAHWYSYDYGTDSLV